MGWSFENEVNVNRPYGVMVSVLDSENKVNVPQLPRPKKKKKRPKSLLPSKIQRILHF